MNTRLTLEKALQHEAHQTRLTVAAAQQRMEEERSNAMTAPDPVRLPTGTESPLYQQSRNSLTRGRGAAMDRVSAMLPTGTLSTPERVPVPNDAVERGHTLPTGDTDYVALLDEQRTARDRVSSLRRELNMAQRSRGMVGNRSPKEIRAELAGAETDLDALGERERDIPQEEKRARWAALAALDRPLTGAERAEAREAIQELRGNPFAAALRTLRGETEDQQDRVKLADALETRVSGRGGLAAGLAAEIPFLGRAAEAGVDRASEIAEEAGIGNPYLRKGANVYRDAPVEHPGAYQAGRGVMSLAELGLLSGGADKATGALPGFKGLPTAAQNAIRSGLAFGAKGALDEAGAGGDPGEVAKAGLVRGAAAAAGSGAASLVGKLGTGLLFQAGLQNAAPAVVLRDGLAGTAFAGADMGTTMALDPEYRPSGGEAAKDLAVAFAFSTLSSLAQTGARTQEAKERLERDVNAMKQDYTAIVGGADGKVTAQALDDLAARSARVRETLGKTQYVGQQETVSGVYQFLDQLDDVVAGARAKVSGIGESVVSGSAEAGTAPVAMGLLTGKDAAQVQKSAPAEAGAYRAATPRNVELPTVPIINLSMEDVAALNGDELPQSGNYLRKTATERAAARLGLDKNPAVYIEASNVTRNGDSYVLKITKSTLKKMLSASSFKSGVVPLESIAVLENLERIANNGVYFKSEGDRYGRDQVAGYDHLMTTVYIDHSPYLVDMRVRVLQQQEGVPLENTLYHFTPESITVTKQDDGGTSTTGRHAPSIKSEIPPSSGTTIPQPGQGVKTQDAQESGAVSGERPLPGGTDIHIDERTWADAGKRKVNAFQYDHPELHGFYAEAARGVLYDLQHSVKGERTPIKDSEGYITGYTGTSRMTSSAVEMALDDAGLSYGQIEKALQNLIADHGQENYAAAKKVELVLDTVLSEGYTDVDGVEHAADESYLSAKNLLKAGLDSGRSDYRMSEEEWAGLMGEMPVDTEHGRAYDGINHMLPRGEDYFARGGEKGAADLGAGSRGTVRLQTGEEGVHPGGAGAVSETFAGVRTGESRTAGGKEIQGWARGHVISGPQNPGTEQALENISMFTPDVAVVEDSAIRSRNPDALALTSNGVIYLSDTIPEDLAAVVSHHEVVHLLKQHQNKAYLEFLDIMGEKIDFTGNPTPVLDVVIKGRFPGKSFFELTISELDTIYDELNALIWGYHKADPENARAQFAGVFTDYDAYIAELDAIMEGARRESGGRPLPGGTDIHIDERTRADAGQNKTASTGETVKDYQKSEHHGTIIDTVRANLEKVASTDPVAILSGQEFQKTAGDGRNLRTKVIDFFNSIGNKVTHRDLGDIELNTSGVRDSLAHGYGKLKAATFAALPQVLEQGEVIAYSGPYEGHDYDSYIISAPVQVGSETVYVGALVIKDRTQRYKLHEVLTTNENGAPLFKSETVGTSTGGPLRNDAPLGESEDSPGTPTIPQTGLGVKTQDAQSEGPRYLPDGKTAAGRAGGEDTLSVTDEDRALWRAAQERRKSAKEPTGAKEEYRGTPATDKLGIQIERPITDLGASQSLRGLEKARYEAGAALNRLLKNSNASKAEYTFAQGVADGTYTIWQTPAGMNRVLIQELAAAVSLRNSYNQKVLQEKRSGDAFAFDARVQELIKNSDQKKSPSAVSLNINTMQRNNERVWGGDAGEINAELFDPVVTNEAERIRFVNRTLSRMEPYHLTTEESAAVQKLMERTVTADELRRDGYDAPRLAEAAKTLSGLYNDFYEAVNDFLVAHGYKEIGFQKNYAPHMQEEQAGTLQRYLQRMGFQVGVTELPTDIAGRTEAFRPGKQYDPYFQHRKGNKTEYDAVGGLESYVNYMSNVFYHTDDIQKLRRFNEALREKYSPAEVAAEIDRLNSLEDRLAEEDIGQDDPGLLRDLREAAYKRAGNMSRFGAYVSVLDDYTNILAGKQSKLDRAVESMFGRRALNLGRNVQNAFSKAAILGNLSSAINQTVQLPQLTAEIGPQFVARAAYDVATGATARAGFNQESDFLTGKVGIQGISEKTGREKRFDFAAKPFEAVDDFASRLIVRSKYLEQVAAGKSHGAALKAADQFAARLVGSRMRGAKPVVFEQKNPFTKLVTTFQLEVANGWEHIVHDLPGEARQIAETQGKMAAAKWVAGLAVGALLANFIANSIIKGITGREPVPFDGLGMAANFMASGYGMTKEDYMKALADNAAESVTGGRPLGTEAPSGAFNLPKAVSALAEDAAEDVPYVGNITTMLGVTDGRLPLPQVWNKKLGAAARNLGNAVFGEEEEREESLAQGLPGLGQGAMELASTWLPMGSQIKKTAQGATALLRGGVYSGYGEDEKLAYNVDRDPANIARGLLFGKSALPETDAYYARGMSALTAKQTGVYRQLRENGVEGEEAYQLLQRLRRTKKTEDTSETMERIRVLEDSGLPEGQKAVVYYGMLASDAEREVMERLGVDGKDADEIFSTLVNIRRATDSEGKTDINRKRDALISARLTDGQKSILYEMLISDGKNDEIRKATGVGLSFDDYLRAENEHHTIDAGKKSAGEKTTDFLHWMDEQGYTDQQIGAVRGAMPFYSHIPAGEVMYDKLVESGFSSDEAYSLSQALDGVSSIKGDDGVNLSASKKKKAAIDAATPGLSQEERWKIYELFHVSRQVWGYTPRDSRRTSGKGALELPTGRDGGDARELPRGGE